METATFQAHACFSLLCLERVALAEATVWLPATCLGAVPSIRLISLMRQLVFIVAKRSKGFWDTRNTESVAPRKEAPGLASHAARCQPGGRSRA